MPPDDWRRLEANKHLVYTVCDAVASMTAIVDPREVATVAQERLQNAAALYQHMARAGVFPRDGADAYQTNWVGVLTDLIDMNQEDFEFLSLL